MKRKFKVGDRVCVTDPGALHGDCPERWSGACGSIIAVEPLGYTGSLVNFVVFDDGFSEELDEIKRFWVTDYEIELISYCTTQRIDVNDLL